MLCFGWGIRELLVGAVMRYENLVVLVQAVWSSKSPSAAEETGANTPAVQARHKLGQDVWHSVSFGRDYSDRWNWVSPGCWRRRNENVECPLGHNRGLVWSIGTVRGRICIFRVYSHPYQLCMCLVWLLRAHLATTSSWLWYMWLRIY